MRTSSRNMKTLSRKMKTSKSEVKFTISTRNKGKFHPQTFGVKVESPKVHTKKITVIKSDIQSNKTNKKKHIVSESESKQPVIEVMDDETYTALLDNIDYEKTECTLFKKFETLIFGVSLPESFEPNTSAKIDISFNPEQYFAEEISTLNFFSPLKEKNPEPLDNIFKGTFDEEEGKLPSMCPFN